MKPSIPKMPYQTTPHSNQRAQSEGCQNQHHSQYRPHNILMRRNDPLDPIPMMYSQLLQPLIQSPLMDPKPLKLVPQPFPPGYDPDVQYGYHARSEGHSIEYCNTSKAKVQQLINNKCIAFIEGNLVVNINLSP